MDGRCVDSSTVRERPMLRMAIVSCSVGLAACARGAPSAESGLDGVWVADVATPLAIQPDDTIPPPGDSTSVTAMQRILTRTFRRGDVEASVDTSFLVDTLVLSNTGTASSTSNQFRRGPHGLKQWNDSLHRWQPMASLPPATIEDYSSWHLRVDSATNAATLCLSPATFDPIECGRIFLHRDTMFVGWRSLNGGFRPYIRVSHP